jgi:predicted SnoaL-like aldol condensation-catalyzing enzyme
MFAYSDGMVQRRSAKMSNLETNKATVRAYYETAFAGQPELAVERYMGDRYIQHNPQADNGPAAFIRFVHELRSQNPELRLDIKRIFAEDDFVITHSHLFLKPGDSGLALADFFRLEKGKVVEHWDVIQPVPEKSANQNTMF